ncbi:hypothetical protein EJ07DRAFT_183024 [Lizonia empirigonia]|nr:hypothetical protein EJ07DRAFT_183024 [Lizonia empirigonia]
MQHWSTSLHNAAGAFDGGARSFPLASEAASISRSQRDLEAAQQSAEWLVPLPNDASACKPVFIAHSVLSVIWLLRETLADNAFSNSGWDCLVSAAQLLAEDSTAEPPSAQKPTASSVQTLSLKRACIGADNTRLVSPCRSEPASDLDAQLDEPLLEEQPTTTTVTNCNRDAERKRIRDHKAAMLERSLDLSLITPDEKAANEEHGAYVAVPVQDRAVVSWRDAGQLEGEGALRFENGAAVGRYCAVAPGEDGPTPLPNWAHIASLAHHVLPARALPAPSAYAARP